MNVEDFLEKKFPKLNGDDYKITSPIDIRYNCIAWAAEDANHWWEPDGFGMCYWPNGVPREYTIEAYLLAFQSLGFNECDNMDFERNYEKIAIFAKNSIPTHVARQLDSGMWTSKLGQNVDIEHNLYDLSESDYGQVVRILRRNKD